MQNNRQATAWLILAAFFWGISFPIVPVIFSEQLSLVPGAEAPFLTTVLVTYRFGLAALIMAPYLFFKKIRFTHLEWQQGVWIALFGGIGLWLQSDGLAYTTASTSAFLTQGYCVLLPLVLAVRTRRIPSGRILVSAVLVLLGVGWISGITLSNLRPGRGEIETLAATCFFAIQILLLENSKYRDNRSIAVTFIMFLGISAIFAPMAFAAAPTSRDLLRLISSPAAFSLLLFAAIFCSIIPYGLMNKWQSHVSSVQAGLIYCTEPIFTALIVLFFPGWLGTMLGRPTPNEVWSLTLVGGGILITAANLLVMQKLPTTSDSP